MLILNGNQLPGIHFVKLQRLLEPDAAVLPTSGVRNGIRKETLGTGKGYPRISFTITACPQQHHSFQTETCLLMLFLFSSVSCNRSTRSVVRYGVAHFRASACSVFFFLPHTEDEITSPAQLQTSWLRGVMEPGGKGSLQDSKFNPPQGLPCSVTPQGTCPPFGSIHLTPHPKHTRSHSLSHCAHRFHFCAVPQCMPDPTAKFPTALSVTRLSGFRFGNTTAWKKC